MIMVWNISIQCSHMIELECREPIIDTLPHLAWHSHGICVKVQFRLEQNRKRVRGCDRLSSCCKQQEPRGSGRAWQQCVGPRGGNHRVCVMLYDEMRSIYSAVSQIYTPLCSVHLYYQGIPVLPHKHLLSKLRGITDETQVILTLWQRVQCMSSQAT